MLEKYGISIPGVVWGFLLVGVGYWLQANFPNEVWMPLAVVVIGAVLKYIEVQTGEDLPDLPGTPVPEEGEVRSYSSSAPARKRPNKAVRWLVG